MTLRDLLQFYFFNVTVLKRGLKEESQEGFLKRGLWKTACLSLSYISQEAKFK